MTVSADMALLRAKASATAFAEALAAAHQLDTGEPRATLRRIAKLAEADQLLADIARHWAEWAALTGASMGQVVKFPGKPSGGVA